MGLRIGRMVMEKEYLSSLMGVLLSYLFPLSLNFRLLFSRSFLLLFVHLRAGQIHKTKID